MPLTQREIRIIREAVETSAEPLTAKQVCKIIGRMEKRARITICETVLKDLVEQGTAFEHPPIRSGCPVRYWYADVVSRVSAQIERIASAASDPPTIGQAKGKI